MWLIGRDDNFIGQILMIFEVKRRTKEEKKRGMFSKIKLGMNKDVAKVQEVRMN